MVTTHPRRIDFLRAPLDLASMEDAVKIAEEAIRTGACCQHACVNAAIVTEVQRDASLRDAFWTFDVVTADGQGVVWGARLLGHMVPERVTGIDLMEALLVLANRQNHSIFLLGAQPRIVERAAEILRAQYPDVRIAGMLHGYFARSCEDEVVDRIASSGADLLFVALGSPERELFLRRNRYRLNVPFAMGVGGTFDVIAGWRRRAPLFLQRLGLEWAFRMVQEPRRLGPRFLVGNSCFLALLGREFVRSHLPRLAILRRRGIQQRE